MTLSGENTFTNGLTPGDLGLSEKFGDWRPGQLLAIERSLMSQRRFIGHAMPTGGGKSVTYMSEALYRGCRSAVLTGTKGLQDQLLDDFSSNGLVSVKGKANFNCTSNSGWTCEQGSHASCSCFSSDKGGCPYRNQYAAALGSDLLVTNYSYWGAIHKFGEGLGEFGLLVLDEAHDCPDVVSSMTSIEITDREVKGVLRSSWPKQPLYIAGWSPWAKLLLPKALKHQASAILASRASRKPADIRESIAAQELVAKLQSLCQVEGEWVVEEVIRRSGRHEGSEGWRLEPVWPAKFAEKVLFRGINKIVLVSATLSKATLRLLGISPAQFDYYEYASPFPPERSPVYSIPTVKLNHKSGPEDYFLLIERLDEIIDKRLDRKGIIHTTSYDRAMKIIQGSRHSAYFMTHTNQPGEAMRTFRQFREMKPPAILVSPSMTTGYDFPHDACEYQIIVKAPYPDLRAKVMQRRMDVDRNYPAYVMSQTLVQACGRGMRSKTDQCETFILDDAVDAVIKRAPDLFPKWWRKLYRTVQRVPDPPPALGV